MTSLLGISCPIRVRIRFESLHEPIQFAASASAHIESLLRVPNIAMCGLTSHTASTSRIRAYGILALVENPEL